MGRVIFRTYNSQRQNPFKKNELSLIGKREETEAHGWRELSKSIELSFALKDCAIRVSLSGSQWIAYLCIFTGH